MSTRRRHERRQSRELRERSERHRRRGLPHELKDPNEPVRYADLGPGTNSPRVDIEGTALHEAGHAAVAIAYGFALDHVTIRPDPDSRTYGYVRFATNPPAGRELPAVIAERDWPEVGKHIVHLLAGPIANARVTLASASEQFGYREDYAHAQREAVIHGIPITAVDRFLTWLSERAEREVTRHWDSIRRIAIALLERETLTGDEVREIVRG